MKESEARNRVCPAGNGVGDWSPGVYDDGSWVRIHESEAFGRQQGAPPVTYKNVCSGRSCMAWVYASPTEGRCGLTRAD